MCMYLTNGNYLGQRLIGYDFYDSVSKGFIGLTEKQVIDKVKRSEKVYGFIIREADGKEELALDIENFNMTNLQIKTGVNSLSWLNEETAFDLNVALIVVAVYTKGNKKTYETVNARHARVEYTEDKIKALIEIGVPVAGVKLEKNRITPCEGVELISDNNDTNDKNDNN